MEQAEVIGGRHPGATDVTLTCALQVCDRKGGAGTAVVTLADGTTVGDRFSYTGDPGPLPDPRCVRIAPADCLRVATEQADEVPPSRRIVRIEMECIAASCTADQGEVHLSITMADGSVTSSSVGWSGAGG